MAMISNPVSRIDKSDPGPGGKGYRKGRGQVYFGWHRGTGKGGGKTEAIWAILGKLLCAGSGFTFIDARGTQDGKTTPSLAQPPNHHTSAKPNRRNAHHTSKESAVLNFFLRRRKAGIPGRVPSEAKRIDKSDPGPGGKGYRKGRGQVYFGRPRGTGKGGGKTEAIWAILCKLLCAGYGFTFIDARGTQDGKTTPSLAQPPNHHWHNPRTITRARNRTGTNEQHRTESHERVRIRLLAREKPKTDQTH